MRNYINVAVSFLKLCEFIDTALFSQAVHVYITTQAHFLFIGRKIAESSTPLSQYLPQNIVDGEISDLDGSFCNKNPQEVNEHVYRGVCNYMYLFLRFSSCFR